MKTTVILDSEFNSTHPMEAVLDRRGFVVLRAGTTEEAIKLLKSADAPVDLVIVEVPLSGSASQTEAAVQIHRSSPEIPILLVSDLSLDKWPEDDFLRFGQFLSGRIDLLVKPLSQASFMSKANALIYTVSYGESKRLFESTAARRLAEARV
jgi:response regulator RpfG family c-di-GMP phosphodiesterase